MKLYGEAAAVCSATHNANMEALRTTVQMNGISNVYNADESDLLYAVIPSRTYLLAQEHRRNVRGIKRMRSKKRVTIMVCTNAD